VYWQNIFFNHRSPPPHDNTIRKNQLIRKKLSSRSLPSCQYSQPKTWHVHVGKDQRAMVRIYGSRPPNILNYDHWFAYGSPSIMDQDWDLLMNRVHLEKKRYLVAPVLFPWSILYSLLFQSYPDPCCKGLTLKSKKTTTLAIWYTWKKDFTQ
jgi:hypothetical protein